MNKESNKLTRVEQKQLGKVAEASVKFAETRSRVLKRHSEDIGEFGIKVKNDNQGFVIIDGQAYHIETHINIRHFNTFSPDEQQELLRNAQATLTQLKNN